MLAVQGRDVIIGLYQLLLPKDDILPGTAAATLLNACNYQFVLETSLSKHMLQIRNTTQDLAMFSPETCSRDDLFRDHPEVLGVSLWASTGCNISRRRFAGSSDTLRASLLDNQQENVLRDGDGCMIEVLSEHAPRSLLHVHLADIPKGPWLLGDLALALLQLGNLKFKISR